MDKGEVSNTASSSKSIPATCPYVLRSSRYSNPKKSQENELNSSEDTVPQAVVSQDSDPTVTVSAHPGACGGSGTSQSQTLEKSLSLETNESVIEEEDMCPICLMEMIHPVRLPCKHIFCFLCLKVCILMIMYS